MNRRFFIFLCLVLASLAFGGSVALAQDYAPLAPIEGYVENTTTATDYITGIYRLAFWAAAVLAVVMIVWGGVQYAGSEAVTSKETAKKQIMAAVGGLVLALGSYLLLQTINPDLVNFNVNIGEIGVKVDTPPTPAPPAPQPQPYFCTNYNQCPGTSDQVDKGDCRPPCGTGQKCCLGQQS